MTHAITEFQTSLVGALAADTQLTALIGVNAIFDAPPQGGALPYIAIMRHDVISRDGDEAPGNDHRLLINCWHEGASRQAVVAIVDRLLVVALDTNLSSAALLVTHSQHDRTDTAIDLETGHARATIALRFFSEPSA